MENDAKTLASATPFYAHPSKRFSGTTAIGDAFGFIKSHPLFFLKFLLLTAIVAIVIEGFNYYSEWFDFNYLDNVFSRTLSQTFHALLDWFVKIWWPVAIAGLVFLIMATLSMEAMVYRKALFGKKSGFLGLQLGKDELRLAAAKVLATTPIIAFYGLLGLMPFSRGANPIVLVLAVLCAFFLGMAMIWIGTRLYLAAVVSQAKNQFDFQEIWHETKNNGWNLIGLQMVLVFIYLVMSLPVGIFLLVGIESMGVNINDRNAMFLPFLNFEMLKPTLVTALFNGFLAILNILVSVSVYKQMNPDFAPTPPNTPTENP